MPSLAPLPEKPTSDAFLDRLRYARRWAQVTDKYQLPEKLEALIEALRSEHRPVNRPRGVPSAGRELEALLLAQLPRPVGEIQEVTVPGSFSISQSLNCIRDEVRTKNFLNAVRHAVGVLAQGQDQIEVVDAGCGAAPILGLYAALLSPKVRVTALELNPEAAKIASAIVKAVGLEERVKVINTDATKYQATSRIDILVSETMHTGLTEEPLVQVLNNLTRFRSAKSIVIPHAVTVYGGVIPIHLFWEREVDCIVDDVRLLTIQPNWLGATEYNPGDPLAEIKLLIEIDRLLPGAYAVVVGSTVDVLPEQQLGENQSQITSPTNVFCGTELKPKHLTIVKKPGAGPSNATVTIRYPPGGTPFGWIEAGGKLLNGSGLYTL